MIRVQLNGEPREVEPGTTILDLVRRTVDDPERAGIAVARNREVIPRGEWREAHLADGDDLEILAPFQGG